MKSDDLPLCETPSLISSWPSAVPPPLARPGQLLPTASLRACLGASQGHHGRISIWKTNTSVQSKQRRLTESSPCGLRPAGPGTAPCPPAASAAPDPIAAPLLHGVTRSPRQETCSLFPDQKGPGPGVIIRRISAGQTWSRSGSGKGFSSWDCQNLADEGQLQRREWDTAQT